MHLMHKIPQNSTVFAIDLKEHYSNFSILYRLFTFQPNDTEQNIQKVCGESIITIKSVSIFNANNHYLFIKVFT